ncbi:MAG: 50S ribosomal protein L13 [Candidatus Zixiibacteriota bacterium]
MTKTFVPKIEPNSRKWWVVDLHDATLGRAAVKVATILRGKNKPIFTPHLDTGDHVIAVNAGGMRVSGNAKPAAKMYYHYTGYPGGLRGISYNDWMKQKPEDVFSIAVRRMLPKNRLGRKMFKKLHVYSGAEHPHKAQKPEILKLS